MADESTEADHQPLASVELKLFGSLAGFLLKVPTLVRDAELDDQGEKLASERIGLLLDQVTPEIGRTKDFDIQHRLDAVYEEMEQFVKELAKDKGGK